MHCVFLQMESALMQNISASQSKAHQSHQLLLLDVLIDTPPMLICPPPALATEAIEATISFPLSTTECTPAMIGYHNHSCFLTPFDLANNYKRGIVAGRLISHLESVARCGKLPTLAAPSPPPACNSLQCNTAQGHPASTPYTIPK